MGAIFKNALAITLVVEYNVEIAAKVLAVTQAKNVVINVFVQNYQILKSESKYV
jgi:hypothetical protein